MTPDRFDGGDESRVQALMAENKRLREALQEIAANKHGFSRPAGKIARYALDGKPLPEWEDR